MADIKVFNGRKYSFLYYKHTKAEAKQEAKKERKKGWNIRIVKRKIGRVTYYDLYGRR